MSGNKAVKILKRLGLGALLLSVILIVGGVFYHQYMQWRIASATRITTPNGIESLEKVRLGGVDQWIYARGQDRDAPVLLWLHGGPGWTFMPTARAVGPRLEAHFVNVHWDQRGAGKSAHEEFPENSLTIEQHVSDTVELINLLRDRFDEEKIYLLGHSWGTMLGTRVAYSHPELLHAYIGTGQVVNLATSEVISRDLVLARAQELGNDEAIADLTAISPPYADSVDDFLVHRKWLISLFEWPSAPPPELDDFDLYMNDKWSPEYTLIDSLTRLKNVLASIEALWPKMVAIDFREEAPVFQVPVFLFAGQSDPVTPASLVREYFDQIEAPQKEYVIFQHSSHDPCHEEPDKCQDILIDTILPNTYSH